MPKAPEREPTIMRFAVLFGLAITFLALIPALLGFTSGKPYLGMQYNLDDHMVYAGWIRQSMEGRFLFENRFTTDPQPGLTLHVYFLALGWLAKVFGIPLTVTLARAGFSFLFVWLLGRLFAKSSLSIYASKLAISLICLGGGVGFLVWQQFGVTFAKESPLAGVMLSRLPTDVWQPEGFVFSSMLTNSLFMVSLCLIVWFFKSVLEIRDNPKVWWQGALAIAVLMNIHSYDVLLIGIVLLGFLGTTFANKSFTTPWVLRVGGMLLGVLPAAFLFMHVLRNDPVFQARAATDTFSPNFRTLLFGYLPGLVVILVGLFMAPEIRRKAGAGGLLVLLGIGFVLSASHLTDAFWMGMPAWIALFLAGLTLCYLLADPENPIKNLFIAWTIMGLIAIYFPALFQRKLAMGLIIPVGGLAAIMIAEIIESKFRSSRNVATALGAIMMSGSSLLWFTRELQLIGQNVSNTTVHSAFLTRDENAIVETLAKVSGPKVVAALPGIPRPAEAKGEFLSPAVNDLNSALVGMAGCKTFAGHWSETPKYNDRRQELVKGIFAAQDIEQARAFCKEKGIQYVVVLDAKSAVVQLPPLEGLGEKVYDGEQLDLIKVTF